MGETAMVKYVLKRLGYTIITLFVLCTLTFFMMRALPGDPFIGETNIPDQGKANLVAKYALAKSVGEQYIMYMGNAARGDLGLPIKFNRPVTTATSDTFAYSLAPGHRCL